VAAGKIEQVKDQAERSTHAAILQVGIRHQQAWALSTSQGLFAVTRRGGHYIHHDNPDLTVDAIHHVLSAAAAGSR